VKLYDKYNIVFNTKGEFNKKKKFKSLEEFEDTKWVIRTVKSKDRQHNGQKKKDKQRYTRHTHKTKDRVTGNPL
jgi:hypothetical protein